MEIGLGMARQALRAGLATMMDGSLAGGPGIVGKQDTASEGECDPDERGSPDLASLSLLVYCSLHR